MRILGKIITGFLAFIGFLVLAPLLVVVAIISFSDGDPLDFATGSGGVQLDPDAPIVLDIDLTYPYLDRPEFDPFAEQGLPRMIHLVEALRQARQDDRVQALVLNAGTGMPLDMAQAQEIRQAILDFKSESTKPVFLYAQDLGGFGSGDTGYFLSTIADEIWLAPSGGVGLTGLAVEMPFFKDLLDEYDIQPQVEQRHEYKGGLDSVIRTEMHPAFRQNLQKLLSDLTEQMQEAVRKTRPDIIPSVWGNGPYLASQAMDFGLIDRVGYEDEFNAMLEKRFAQSQWIDLFDYAHFDRLTPSVEGQDIALVYGDGVIDGDQSFGNEGSFRSYDVADALLDARLDDSIQGVILRVNSPGGAYSLSDMVWREVMLLKQAGKPVVVSMGSYAASGGYFVSMAADHVIAQPGTVTGSIGVYSGKFATEILWERFGVQWDRIEMGQNAGMHSFVRPLNDTERKRFQQSVDFVYDDFTRKVADNRNLNADQLDAAARGRIWSGESALEVGLVDRLGGMETAFEVMAEQLNLSVDDLHIVEMPGEKGLAEFFEALKDEGFSLTVMKQAFSFYIFGQNQPEWLVLLRWMAMANGPQLILQPMILRQ